MIGTNKKDATETIDLLVEDARRGKLHRRDPIATAETVDELLAARGVEAVTYTGWEAIDLAERTAGGPHGRPRIKLLTWDELCAAARDRSSVRLKPDARIWRDRLEPVPALGAAHPFEGREPSTEGRFSCMEIRLRQVECLSCWLPPRRPRRPAPLRSRRVPEVPLRGLGRERGALRAHPSAAPRAAGRPPPPPRGLTAKSPRDDFARLKAVRSPGPERRSRAKPVSATPHCDRLGD